MDVFAFTHGASSKIELGSIADSIWVNGFKFTEERSLQVSKPMNAAAPNIFDRVTVVENFQFAAARSFGGDKNPGSLAVAAALEFMGTHPGTVPHVADLQFIQQGGELWLRYCGIMKVELIEKKSALVIFGYTIVGGTWAKTRS